MQKDRDLRKKKLLPKLVSRNMTIKKTKQMKMRKLHLKTMISLIERKQLGV